MSSWTKGVWADENYIYASNSSYGFMAFTFDGTKFKKISSMNTNSTAAGRFWVTDNFIFVTDAPALNTGNIDVYKKDLKTETCSCSSPAQTEGTLLYNSTYNKLQFCNGQVWQSLGK
jgi:hypothetical protein